MCKGLNTIETLHPKDSGNGELEVERLINQPDLNLIVLGESYINILVDLDWLGLMAILGSWNRNRTIR